MLYDVASPDISVLTHSNHPLYADNGFDQVRGKKITPPAPVTDLFFSGQMGDLGSLLSKTVKKAAKNPIKALTTTAAKISTGGVTLITETGVLGKDAKKAGQKLEVVASGVIGGGAAGFVTSGFNPAGAIAGGVAGGTKGVIEATKTSKSGDSVKALYQGAGYGAAAGVATAAVNYGVSSYENAQIAKSAATAAKVGYGAASDTAMAAGGYVPGAAASPGAIATAGKFAASLGKSALTTYGTIAVAQAMGPKAGSPGDGGYQPPGVVLPGDAGGVSNQPSISIGIPSGGGGGDTSGGGMVSPTATPDAQPGTLSRLGAHPLLLAAVPLLFFVVMKKRRA